MHALPVSFTQTAQPHETLLKAVMPQPLAQRITHARAHRQPRLLLTTTPEPIARDQHRQTRNVYRQAYVLTDFSPSYAAVPFGNGWLIIQL